MYPYLYTLRYVSMTVGSRRQVYNGTVHHTTGGLGQGDLVMNRRNLIVPKKKVAQGKKSFKNVVGWNDLVTSVYDVKRVPLSDAMKIAKRMTASKLASRGWSATPENKRKVWSMLVQEMGR